MARMIRSGIDVVTFLKEQHDQIEAGFQQVTASSGEERENAMLDHARDAISRKL